MIAERTAQIGHPAMRSLTRAKLLGATVIRFLRIALLLLALTSAGLTPLSAQGLGPIAYNKPNLLGDLDLWFIQPNGTGDTLVPITYNPGVCDQCPLLGAQHPVWSRNGQLIAVTGLISGQGFQHLAGGYAMVVFQPSNPTGTLTDLAPLGTVLGGGPAAFSPDGTQLAFTDPGPGFHEYRVINLDGSNPRNITLVPGEQVPFPGLDWSPTDAKTLVVSMVDRSLANVQGNTQLALVPPIEGGVSSARPLTQPPYNLRYVFSDVNPSFSPDGRFVAFSRFSQDLWSGVSWTDIRVIDVAQPGDRQGQLRLQLPPGEFVGNLSWSAGGLVFDRQTQFGDGGGLWIYNGSSVVRLQQPPARNPAWSGASR